MKRPFHISATSVPHTFKQGDAGEAVVFATKLAGVFPMTDSSKDETGPTLRINPEALKVLRAIAPLPDLDELRVVVIEPAPVRAPSPKNRSRIPYSLAG
jgi:hypothetical protein